MGRFFVYGKIFHCSRASNYEVNGPIWPEIELVRDFMAVLLSVMKIRSKMKLLSSGQYFPHYKSMGAFGCRGNLSFEPVCPKSLSCLSSIQLMLYIKFDRDWSTDLRDIQV